MSELFKTWAELGVEAATLPRPLATYESARADKARLTAHVPRLVASGLLPVLPDGQHYAVTQLGVCIAGTAIPASRELAHLRTEVNELRERLARLERQLSAQMPIGLLPVWPNNPPIDLSTYRLPPGCVAVANSCGPTTPDAY